MRAGPRRPNRNQPPAARREHGGRGEADPQPLLRAGVRVRGRRRGPRQGALAHAGRLAHVVGGTAAAADEAAGRRHDGGGADRARGVSSSFFSAWISWLSRSISSRKRLCMKKARLKVVGLKLLSIISFDSVLCQVAASAIRCSRGTRLFLSRAATGAGSGVPSFGRVDRVDQRGVALPRAAAAAGRRSPVSSS